MRHWRWPLLGLLIIIVFFAVITAKKPVHHLPEKIKVHPSDSAHIMIKDVSLSLVDEQDVVRWELKIKEAKEFSGGMTIYNVSGRYFPDNGQPFTLTARTGQINKSMNELILSPDVVLTQADYRLKGRQLVWKARNKGFQINGGVVLDSLTMHGEGERLITDSSLKRVRFEGRSLWRSNSNLPKGGQKH